MITINSKFAIVDLTNREIHLKDTPPLGNGFSDILENCTIHIDNHTLTIKGDLWLWGFATYKTLVSELNSEPIEKHVKFGYKSLFDFFKKKKTGYVFGWYRKKETSPFECNMSEWSLIS